VAWVHTMGRIRSASRLRSCHDAELGLPVHPGWNCWLEDIDLGARLEAGLFLYWLNFYLVVLARCGPGLLR